MESKIERIYQTKAWVQDGFSGDKKVMIQHDDGNSEPFCFCTFHYDHRYTYNAGILNAAKEMAARISGQNSVDVRFVPEV